MVDIENLYRYNIESINSILDQKITSKIKNTIYKLAKTYVNKYINSLNIDKEWLIDTVLSYLINDNDIDDIDKLCKDEIKIFDIPEYIEAIIKCLYHIRSSEKTLTESCNQYITLLIIKSILENLSISTIVSGNIYLYGAIYFDFIEYKIAEQNLEHTKTNVKYYIFGEYHNPNTYNIPTYGIYMYELFEKLIELNIKQNRHVHIFLESGYNKYTKKKDFSVHQLYNKFLVDACDVYYYLNICQRYLKLNSDDLYIQSKFNRLINAYDFDTTIISNFINNFRESITFHYIDHREIVQRLQKKYKDIIKSTKLVDNILIFPEKYYSDVPDLKERLSIIMSNNENITIYRKLYDELFAAGYINNEICEIIDSNIEEYDITVNDYIITFIMDHITILKFLYLEYKRGNREETILFHGGSYHSELYSKILPKLIKGDIYNRKTSKNNNLYNNIEILCDISSIITEIPDLTILFEKKNRIDHNVCIYKNLHTLYTNIYFINTNTSRSIDIDIDEYTLDKCISTKFIASCKSKITDSDTKSDLTGGQENVLPQQKMQIYVPQRKQLNALEQVELVELHLFFKDVDILKRAKSLLDFAQSDAESYHTSLDLTGGNWLANPWLRFILG